MARKILDKRGIKQKGITYSNAHLLRMERDGLFVRRFYLSESRAVWFEDEVDAWLEARAAERENPKPQRPRGCHLKATPTPPPAEPVPLRRGPARPRRHPPSGTSDEPVAPPPASEFAPLKRRPSRSRKNPSPGTSDQSDHPPIAAARR